MANLYTHKNFSPARNIPSPRPRTNADVESQYLSELLSERQKLAPFMQVLPVCSRLLDQEIMRVSGRISNHGFNNYDRLHSPFSSLDVMAPNPLGQLPLSSWNWNDWSRLHSEQWLNGGVEGMPVDWRPPGSPSSFPGKRVLRLGIPVDAYPNFNFVGRLLGPRGNSLKRVEASTGCRVFIRGRGSLKDTEKEENLRGKPGYEHLNEPLHILIEPDAAQVPAGIVDIRLKQAKEIIEELLKPVEESQDVYKKEQLRELAMLRNVGEESPQPNGSLSPFTSGGIKRPKTGW